MNDAKEKFGNAVKKIQDDTAVDKEVELWAGTYSPKAMYGSWLAGGAVTVIGLIGMIWLLSGHTYAWIAYLIFIALMWLALTGIALYHKLSHFYELSNQRLKHRDGLLIRTMNRVELIDMDDVTYVQGPIQTLLKVGNITIKSSDVSHPVLVLKGISDVKRIAELIDDARRSERRRRGLFMEAV